MKRESPTARPAEVGALAAKMAREALTPQTRIQALAALRAHWSPTSTHRPPSSALANALPPAAEYVEALGRWAQSIRFVREPLAVGEVVQAPWRTVAYRAGDCDDLACCVAAFAAVVGLPSVVAVYESEPGHAHACALVGNEWYGGAENRGRLTHMIDHSGARAAPDDILTRSAIFPVSGGM